MDEIRVLAPTAILGYGFPEESFRRGIQKRPHVIAVDAGSTDPGPYYLGAGKSFTDRLAVKRDLEIMLVAGLEHNIPVIIGSAGGAGARPHIEWNLAIIEEIAKEQDLHFKLAVIAADISHNAVLTALEQGSIRGLPGVEPLTSEAVNQSTQIVAQMGVEPIIKALDGGAQVVLAGRAYDPAVFAAVPIQKGFDPGLAQHMGKILECASIAAVPGSGSDCMLGYLYQDSFVLEPLNPERQCTVTSVAGHTLYEKTDPYHLPGPGGVINLEHTSFEQLDSGKVRVRGSRLDSTSDYWLKLEGAQLVGYRTVSLAGARDPVFISELDNILQGVQARVTDNFKELNSADYHLIFRVYGRDGVMGQLEPDKTIKGHEVGLVIEAVAKNQALADTICSFARSTMLHYGYPGRLATAGNLAFPYSPSDFRGGEVYNFSIYHLIRVDDPVELFPSTYLQL